MVQSSLAPMEPLVSRSRSARNIAPGLLVIAALVVETFPVRAEVDWADPIEVAAGGGHKGPWRMNASRFHYVDDPTVAINDEGVVGVAFADLSRLDIFFQRYGPNGEKPVNAPVNVSRTGSIFSWLPRVVITSGEPVQVYVLWQEIVFSGGSHGGEVFFARSSDGGTTFDRPVNLSNSTPGDGKGRLTRRYWDNGSLDLVAGSRGELYAAWTEYEGTLWFRRSLDGGKSFSEALRIAGGDAAAPARGPSLGVAPDDTIYIAWAVGEDPAADVHFTKSADGGRTFDTPRVVSESRGHADAPRLAVDGNGVVHLVFAESPAGPFQRYDIRYVSSRNGGRTFENPRVIADPDAGGVDSVGFPSLGINSEGHLYVLFELFPDRGRRSRGLGLTHSSDGGRTFAPPVVVPGSADPDAGINGSQQGLLMRKLAVNKAGAIAVVNSTFKPGQSSHVRLFRGQPVRR